MTSTRPAPPQSSPLTHPKYRPDIDGLRAVAVLSVVVFHAFPDWLQGGFIGVDIFFVISGYLISTILFENLERGTFSFQEFYVRRIKRIFPALLLVLVACLVFGWFALYPDEYQQLGTHLAAGAGFLANFIFWGESGYFDNAADTKPLLHLWSLGIEEQFYIVWPLLLWLAWKRKINLLVMTLLVACLSFALNIVQVRGDAVAAFYSPITRFWELLAGSILAYSTRLRCNEAASAPPKLATASVAMVPCWVLRNVQSFFGLALMGVGLLVINKGRSFPGWWALLPTVAAVLVIAAGPQAWPNRAILSSRVLVRIGLISFPLYLWHWPLLSFVRIVADGKPAPQAIVAAVLTSVLLAGLTYQWLEKPIRTGRLQWFSTRAMLLSMIVVGFAGFFTKQQDGWPARKAMNLEVVRHGDIGHETFHAAKSQHVNFCAQYIQHAVACFQSDRSEREKVAVIGDSHADHLALGLAGVLQQRNVVFFDALGLPLFSSKEGAALLQSIMADQKISRVILSASWYARLDSVPATSSLEAELTRVATELSAAGKQVFIVDDVPNFSFPPRNCRYQGNWLRASQCHEERGLFFHQHGHYFPVLESVKKKTKAQVIRISDYFCDQDFCSMEKDGVLFYRDNNHLNLNGSRYVAQKMLQNTPQLAAELP